jgi:hypothetical protein
VEVVAGKRKEDVEGGGGERVELAARHSRGTIYRLTSIADFESELRRACVDLKCQ